MSSTDRTSFYCCSFSGWKTGLISTPSALIQGEKRQRKEILLLHNTYIWDTSLNELGL